MKKLIVLTLIFVLLSVTFIPAMAQTGPSGSQVYALAGYIKEIDATNHTITVEVIVGNRLMTPLLKQQVEIQTHIVAEGDFEATRFLIAGGIPSSFLQLTVGNTVSSNGYAIDTDGDGDMDEWHALRVTRDTTASNW